MRGYLRIALFGKDETWTGCRIRQLPRYPPRSVTAGNGARSAGDPEKDPPAVAFEQNGRTRVRRLPRYTVGLVVAGQYAAFQSW